jgi:hypothetical protein
MLAEFDAPPRDRYQVITQHNEGEMIFEDTELGFERSDELVLVPIYLQGPTPAMKKAIYASICSQLSKECDGPSAFLVFFLGRRREDFGKTSKVRDCSPPSPPPSVLPPTDAMDTLDTSRGLYVIPTLF